MTSNCKTKGCNMMLAKPREWSIYHHRFFPEYCEFCQFKRHGVPLNNRFADDSRRDGRYRSRKPASKWGTFGMSVFNWKSPNRKKV